MKFCRLSENVSVGFIPKKKLTLIIFSLGRTRFNLCSCHTLMKFDSYLPYDPGLVIWNHLKSILKVSWRYIVLARNTKFWMPNRYGHVHLSVNSKKKEIFSKHFQIVHVGSGGCSFISLLPLLLEVVENLVSWRPRWCACSQLNLERVIVLNSWVMGR